MDSDGHAEALPEGRASESEEEPSTDDEDASLQSSDATLNAATTVRMSTTTAKPSSSSANLCCFAQSLNVLRRLSFISLLLLPGLSGWRSIFIFKIYFSLCPTILVELMKDSTFILCMHTNSAMLMNLLMSSTIITWSWMIICCEAYAYLHFSHGALNNLSI